MLVDILYWLIIITLLVLIGILYYWQSKYERCKSQLVDYKKQLKNQEKAISGKETKIQSFSANDNQQIAELSTQINNLNSTVEQKKQKISEFEEELGRTSKEKSSLEKQIEVLKKRFKNDEETMKDYEGKIAGFKKQIKRLSKFQKMIIDLRKNLKNEGLHLKNQEVQKTNLIEIIRRFTFKYALFSAKQFPNRLLGIGKNDKWILSEPLAKPIKYASDEYSFALGKDADILHYNTLENVLIPKMINDSNNRNVMIERPEQDDHDQWSKITFTISGETEPEFNLITTVENDKDFVLIVDENKEPYMGKYEESISEKYIRWDLGELR